MKVTELWHIVRGPQLLQHMKNLLVGNWCNWIEYLL